MEFLGISLWELLLILVVAVIVLGPNKIPGIARNIGKALRTIRKAGSEITTALTKELESEDTTQTPPETEHTHHITSTVTRPGLPDNSKKDPPGPESQPPQDEPR